MTIDWTPRRRPARRPRSRARASGSSRSTPPATPPTCSPPPAGRRRAVGLPPLRPVRRRRRAAPRTCERRPRPRTRSSTRSSSTAPRAASSATCASSPRTACIEIGHIWFGAPLQRTPAATEAIYLLAREAFDGLGNRRLEWKCNAAQRALAPRGGAVRLHVRGRLPPAHDRQGPQPRHRLVLDPRRRVAGRARRRSRRGWTPANFDADGAPAAARSASHSPAARTGEAEEPDPERDQREADRDDHHLVEHAAAAGRGAFGAHRAQPGRAVRVRSWRR